MGPIWVAGVVRPPRMISNNIFAKTLHVLNSLTPLSTSAEGLFARKEMTFLLNCHQAICPPYNTG